MFAEHPCDVAHAKNVIRERKLCRVTLQEFLYEVREFLISRNKGELKIQQECGSAQDLWMKMSR